MSAALLPGERVWIVIHTDRFGTGNWAFSSEARANAFCELFVRERWAANHPHEPIPEDAQEMYERWDELEPDETLEQDHVLIDEAT